VSDEEPLDPVLAVFDWVVVGAVEPVELVVGDELVWPVPLPEDDVLVPVVSSVEVGSVVTGLPVSVVPVVPVVPFSESGGAPSSPEVVEVVLGSLAPPDPGLCEGVSEPRVPPVTCCLWCLAVLCGGATLTVEAWRWGITTVGAGDAATSTAGCSAAGAGAAGAAGAAATTRAARW
jgi:hypothetical protein